MKLDFAEGSTIGPMVAAPVTIKAAVPPLSFDLPRSVLRQLVLATAGYVAVMAFAFRQGIGLGLIFAIFGLVLAGYYGLPVLMARASGATTRDDRRGVWGIDTASGYLPGRAAWAQIMTVPLLMLGWAILVAILH